MIRPEAFWPVFCLSFAIAALCFFALCLYWSFDEDHLPDECPNFYREMPEDAPGDYVAAAHTAGFFCGRVWKSEIVSGRRAAYIRARELALDCDRNTRECAVRWSITRIAEGKQRTEAETMANEI